MSNSKKTIKPFMELYNLDLDGLVKLKPTFIREGNRTVRDPDQSRWLKYLEWSTVLRLLYENGAQKVRFGAVSLTGYVQQPVPDIYEVSGGGHPAIYDTNGGAPFVNIFVDIDGERCYLRYPVISGSRVSEKPNQLQIHVAEMRGFVKCVAVNWGLGLRLWNSEEEDLNKVKQEELNQTTREKMKNLNEALIDGVAKLLKKASSVTSDVNDVLSIFDTNKAGLTKLLKNGTPAGYDEKMELLDSVNVWQNADKKSLIERVKKS